MSDFYDNLLKHESRKLHAIKVKLTDMELGQAEKTTAKVMALLQSAVTVATRMESCARAMAKEKTV